MPYLFLGGAIVCEVIGSSLLQKTDGFTKLVPTLSMVMFLGVSLFCLSQALKVIPLGVAYAIWAGLGIVLTAAVSALVFRHPLDAPAYIGIAMICSGVIVMNLFSQATGH